MPINSLSVCLNYNGNYYRRVCSTLIISGYFRLHKICRATSCGPKPMPTNTTSYRNSKTAEYLRSLPDSFIINKVYREDAKVQRNAKSLRTFAPSRLRGICFKQITIFSLTCFPKSSIMDEQRDERLWRIAKRRA